MSEQLPGAAPSGDADPLHEYATLYPEVAEAGSVRGALQAAADCAGHELAVELMSSGCWPLVAAKAQAGGREATVVMLGGGERQFAVDCWANGIHMASGRAQDLAVVAGAVHAWVRAGAGVRELTARWPCLRTWELAEARTPTSGTSSRPPTPSRGSGAPPAGSIRHRAAMVSASPRSWGRRCTGSPSAAGPSRRSVTTCRGPGRWAAVASR
ncbi:hypothetical protein ACIG5E_35050 [Kitasatospora sp. NPDC053057]|uniref:hypothetical protein n=1 Tax=Kitasatospora sp. NPDC053057 TaxID=3364062 RepID=UPI0037C90A16